MGTRMRNVQAALIVCMLLFAPLGAAAGAARESVSVKDMGAVGDGKADDTAAFEKAIARSAETGAQVFVPFGKYRITRGLTLKSQVLTGPAVGAWGADDVSMPTIITCAKDVPAFRLDKGAGIHGLNIIYDWQGREPSPRPPVIEIAGIGCRVSEMVIRSAWDGIMADGKSNVGRACIEQCFIVDCHHIGVRMTGTWDVSWVSKVEVWSPASKAFPDSGVGFQFGKNDVLLVSDCFVYRAQVGYQLLSEIAGCEIKGGTWGSFSNCVSDFCSVGFEVKGEHTVSVVGGSHWSHFGGVVVRSGKAQVRISGVEIAANGASALAVDGGDLVTVASCQIRRLQQERDAPALRIT
ncbi:MAG: glycosyl hydrolase family 28-related protein, partial [Armatimonadota bacterium]